MIERYKVNITYQHNEKTSKQYETIIYCDDLISVANLIIKNRAKRGYSPIRFDVVKYYQLL